MSLFDDAKLIITPNGYKAGKLYSLKPFDGSGDCTVVRNTTATRVKSGGLIESVGVNVPRLDYSGGVTCPAVLVEPQDTNVTNYSEQLDNAYWNKARLTVTANDIIAPDGLLTADKLIPSIDNNTHILNKVGFTASDEVKVFSLFLKAAEYNSARILLRGGSLFGNRVQLELNVSDGTIYSSEAFGTFTGLDFLVEEYINGWYKVQLKGFVPASETSVQIGLFIGNDNEFSFAGDGTSGIYACGLGITDDFGSYIPTVDSTVTRNADVIPATVPAGVTEITEYFEDNTTNVITTIPVTYTMSVGRISKVVMI